ncbi:MAG: lipocalin family protein [Oscillospiraceae bacterium]|nr:lipocalin family protein [Oscillospiraceae bacterium]
MKKNLNVALALAIMVTFLLPITQQEAVASDMSAPNLDTADSWAHGGITEALGKGFVPPAIQDNYKSVITRAEFCVLAVRWVEYALDKPIAEIVTERGLPERMSHTFSDTDDPNILAAYRIGITGGEVAPTDSTPGRFNPDGQFNRQQAATMILNTCRAIGADVSAPPIADFSDMDAADSWARPGINFVRANGIMSGTSTANPPTFTPLRTYTRQESVVTFNNTNLDKLGISNNPPIDVGIVGVWALESIVISGVTVSEDEYGNLFSAGTPYYWFNDDGTVSMFNHTIEYDVSNDTYINIVEFGTYVQNGTSISITNSEGYVTTLTKNGEILILQADSIILRFRYQWIAE